MEGRIAVYALHARGGDCFVVDFGNGHALLIDGGFKENCRKELIPLLNRLNKKGVVLDYVILTHYDSDHINGLIEFMSENGRFGSEKIIKVGGVIANGFSNVVKHDGEVEGRAVDAVSQYPVENEISAKDEYSFEMLCLENGYTINQFKEGQGVICEDKVKQNGYEIRFVSPSREQLDNYYAEMINKAKNDGTALTELNLQNIAINSQVRSGVVVFSEQDICSCGVDDIMNWTELEYTRTLSMPNQSCLAFEILFRGKTLLFCGDADMNAYRDSLRQRYDFIKLSHHGTVRGNECFFGDGKVVADKYLVSTDGSHRIRNHPSKRLLGELLTDGRKKTVYFNYDISETSNEDFSLLRNEELQCIYGFYIRLGRNCILV